MSKLKAYATAGAAMLSVLTFASPAGAVSSFFNDWESTDFGSGAGYTILPSYEGWNDVTGKNGSGIEVQYNNVAGLAFSGENLVELDSNLNSIMEYGSLIDPGNYTLSFWYSPRPGIGLGSNGIDVLLNGVSIFNVTGTGGAQTNWAFQSLTFSLAAPGTLQFAATGTSDSLGGYIDDVRLAGAVPEPSTWAMMIAGFGVVGLSFRRKRTAKVSFA